MRTKHLFSAVTIAALFAACSNEELVAPSAPSFVKDGRPTVENVKLAFQKAGETNTRISFDPATEKYSWEDGDKIGALLMDEIPVTQTLRPHSDPAAWGKLSWLEKYSLTNYIHTNYPFTYSKTNDTWTSAAAMLEGNYFFASPYEGYNSKRQLIHSIGAQTQKDGTLASTAAAYAKNQYWIGYSQIKEGNKTEEALTTVEMTRVLAPIRFTIKMISTQTYHVNKISIQGKDVRTQLTIDPTCAFKVPATPPTTTKSVGYKGENELGDYNLQDGNGTPTTSFNYANYISQLKGGIYAAAMKEEVYKSTSAVTAQHNQVYNIDAVSNYNRFNALRAIVDVESVKEENEVQYAEMTYDTPQKITTGETINGVIFVNPDLIVGEKELTMNIFTEEGLIKDINLTEVNDETDKTAGRTTVLTDKAIVKLAPNEKNLVNIQVDDNSVSKANEMSINNSDDLKQFIDWNKGINRPYTATLANSVTLSKEMVETLRAVKQANIGNQLTVKGSATNADAQLFIADDVAADVFSYVKLPEVTTEILGTATLDASALELPATNKKLIVAKGATLNIASPKTTVLLEVENNGTIAMAAGTSVKNIKVLNAEKATMNIAGSLEFASGSINNGTINVLAAGELKGTVAGNITNNKLIVNDGKIYNIVNANLKEVLVKANGTVNHFNSNGAKATIQLEKLSTSVTGTTTPGHVLYEGADVDLDEATLAGVTDLVVSGFLRVDAATATATVKTITVKEGKTALIEGGAYQPNGTWKADLQKLNVVTSGAVIDLSGAVTMKNLTSAVKANVNVLKGSLTIDKTVAAIDDLTLGSVKDFEEFVATVTINKDAVLTIAGAVARDIKLQTVRPVINNNGTASAVTKTDIPAKITVNGNGIL